MIKFSTLIICICFFVVFAEKSDSTKWYRKTISDFQTCYFGFSNEMGDIHKSESNFWGFDLGVLLSKKPKGEMNTAIIVGLGGSWLDNSIVEDLYINDSTYLSYPLHMKFGGIRLGVQFLNNSMFQPSFDVLVAAGDIQYKIPDNTFKNYKVYVGERIDAVGVIMPKINFDIKIFKYLKFGWGLSYRFVIGTDEPWTSDSKASDFGYHGIFKVGNF